MKKRGKRILLVLIAVGVFCLLVLVSLNLYMISYTSGYLFSERDFAALDADYILVLGAAVRPDGTPSDMLADRIYQGVALYKNGAAGILLMSGDSEHPDYDETGKMKEYAEADGVPGDAIVRDTVGLSTYDSVVRAAAQMPGKKVIIVTQKYHLYRAVYIARKLGLEAYGCPSDPRKYAGQPVRDCREFIARGKDVITAFLRPVTKYGTEVPFS